MTALMEPCWVCYDGIDVVNSGRARAYWSAMGGNACGPGCGSRWSSGLCGPDGETYTDPFTDDLTGNVWWLDPSQPGYDDIIGITGTELSVSHGVRTGVGVTSWGGHAGPTRYGPMEIQLSGVVHTRSKAGTAAARAMLLPALLGGACRTGCVPPDLKFFEACDCDGTGGLLRVVRGAQLMAQDFEWDSEYPRDCGAKFTATFKSTSPFLWWPDINWVIQNQLVSEGQCLAVCDVCPETSTGTCDCGCLSSLVLPPRITTKIGCACPPLAAKRVCVTVDPPSLWNTAAIVLDVYAGAKELRNLRIRGWANPLGYPPPTPANNPFRCDTPCFDVEIGCVPAFGTVRVDGGLRDATIRCVDGTRRPALSTLSSGGRGLKWPEITGCQPMIVCVDADGLNTAADATVSLGLQRAELT